jgi:cell division septation protein DedD
MRLNDISKRQVSEKLENWIGNYGASTVQQMKNRMKGDTEGELSVAEKMGKNKFINDFVARAYATLNSEIQSGRVDPSASSTPKPKTPAEIRAEKQKVAAANAQSQMASPAKPAAPQKVDPQAAAKLKGKLKAGQGLGKKTGAGFKDYVGGSGAVQRESRYDRLNTIFESLLTEAESVGQFFKRWLPTYMKGVNLSDPHTQSLIQSIEDTYAQDKGKAALTQLANASYAASFASGYGGQAQQGPQASDAMMKAISTASNAIELAAGIRTAMTRLNALDKTAYSSFVQELVKAANTPVPAEPAAKAATTTGAVRGNKPGAPTPDEYANLEKRIQSQMGTK